MQCCHLWHHQHHVTGKLSSPCTWQILICPSNATYKPHVLISSCAYIHNYVRIYASYKPNAMYSVTRNTDIHTFQITGIWPWTNMPVALQIYVPLHNYCGLHIDPTLLYIQVQTQQSPTGTPNIIAKYVPETNMTLKCHICQLVHVQIWDNYVSIYTSY